jgi:hypothetical protein
MKASMKFSEDKRIIGTPRYASFQRMCNEAGLFAIKEAQDKGLPITYVENEDIIKEYADGRKEVLGRIKPAVRIKKRVYKLP